MKYISKCLVVLITLILLNNINIKACDTNSKLDITKLNRWNIYLTIEEIEMLSRIVQLEAGGEIIESKYATIETILNRIYSEKYPNTLEEVLSQKGQFSTWENINIDKANPTEDTYIAVTNVLIGKSDVLEMDRLKFNNKPIGKNPIKIGNQYYGK